MRKRGGGFTLMELMIVIAIIMILSGAIIARIGTGSEKAKIAKATSELNEIAAACRVFRLDTGLWPKNVSVLVSAPTNEGYDDQTFQKVGNILSKPPYLEVAQNTVPPDPWGHDYGVWVLTVDQKKVGHNNLYAWSNGPNGSFQAANYDTGEANGDDIAVLLHRCNP